MVLSRNAASDVMHAMRRKIDKLQGLLSMSVQWLFCLNQTGIVSPPLNALIINQ